MGNKRKIRIGILGAGGYGGTARAYLRHTGEYDIVACMDVDRETAERSALEEDAKPYTDLEAFLADDNIEAVSINTPISLHFEHFERSLKAGKHVFVTKPVTALMTEAEKIEELASECNLVCMVGHHDRYSPISRLVKKILDEEKLGRLCNVVATCCSSTALVQSSEDWRVQGGKNPGGPMLQCGIHKIDFLIGLLGPIERVSAMMQDDITRFEPVDNTITMMAFRNGTQAAFVCNYATAYMHTMHFLGTEANLHVHEHVTGYGQSEVYLQQRAEGIHEPWQALRIPLDNSYADKHGGVLERNFAEQIRSGQPDYTNLCESIDALRVVHAALESHRTGQVITFCQPSQKV